MHATIEIRKDKKATANHLAYERPSGYRVWKYRPKECDCTSYNNAEEFVRSEKVDRVIRLVG